MYKEFEWQAPAKGTEPIGAWNDSGLRALSIADSTAKRISGNMRLKLQPENRSQLL